MRIIKFFRNSNGGSPVEEFLDGLSSKQARKITWVMKLIVEMEIIPEIYFKKLQGSNNIWEIRIQTNLSIFRILGFFDKDFFVATNGFCKKSQKTPFNEIFLAEKRKSEYLDNRGKENDRFKQIH